MDRYSFHKEFVKDNTVRLKELFNELHVCYQVRNSLYQDLKQHKELFRVIGIDFSVIDNMLFDSKSHRIITPKNRRFLSEDMAKTINAYIYSCTAKIPKVKHELNIVRLLCQIPDRIYFSIQYWFNREIGNSIVRGGIYEFGKGLSKLGISYVLRRDNAKPVVDWGESNKLKKQLIEEGYTIKSKDDPTGIKWLLFRTDAGYCFWKWLKTTAFTPNKKMYKFRAIATNNECTDYQGELNIEEILDKSIGTFDKMMAMLKLNPLMIKRYDF